jgi:hypothetical protein
MYTLIAAAKFRRVMEYDALSACSGMIWRRDQWFGGCGRGRLVFGWRAASAQLLDRARFGYVRLTTPRSTHSRTVIALKYIFRTIHP